MKHHIKHVPVLALILVVLPFFAGQSTLQAQGTVLPHSGQPQHTASGELTSRKPFIRPIAPMGPLFAKDGFFRVATSTVAAPSWPATCQHSRPVTRQVFSEMKANMQAGVDPDMRSGASADLRPSPPSSILTSDSLTPLGRLLYERTSASMSTDPAISKPLSSALLPATTISPARARQIQEALAQFGYLAGTPSGSWDPASIAAMRKLQSDHRWQTKFMPDARALILLGLGPGSHVPLTAN